MRRRSGFTLVELLVIIGILLVLMALLLPMLNTARKGAIRSATLADLQGIAQALDQYKEDFGDYPQMSNALPNTVTGSPASTPASGAVLLCWALIAPGPATSTAGQVLDGADGPGFRLHGTQGKVYGPYLNVEHYRFGALLGASGTIAATIPPPNPVDNTQTVLADRDGNAILYFPGNKQVSPSMQGLVDSSQPIGTQPPTSVYNSNDNSLPAAPTAQTTLTPKLMAYKLGATSAASTPYKTVGAEKGVVAPYLLWAAGPDGVMGPKTAGPAPTDPTTGEDDDVTYPELSPIPAGIAP